MISLSAKSKYGLLAILAMASTPEHSLQSKQIATQEKLPQPYLEQLLAELKKAGLVKSFRGRHGGYILGKPPEQISVYDILICLEGPSELCNGGPNSLEWFWKQKETELSNLFNMTLQDLVTQHQKQQGKWTYSI